MLVFGCRNNPQPGTEPAKLNYNNTMVKDYQFRVTPQAAYSEQSISEYIAQEEGLDVRTINTVRVLKRSIDARQRQVYVNLTVRVYINEMPQDNGFVKIDYPDVSRGKPVVVVGEGPAGLFASLRLIEHGFRPIVIERGKDVRERKKDLAKIKSEQRVDPESNYCFGEGGAGAYSDGKLYTRSKKRGSIEKILNVFCQFGASTSILADAHPHIGTDRLPRVIENMRLQIIKSGGEVHFQTKMTELLLSGDEVKGVVCRNMQTMSEEIYEGPVILATGHSARDVYRYLAHSGIEIEAKGIAVGVRLEHPSHLIDQIQYHNRQGRGRWLPAAEYSFVTQVEGRGVYSFCMCPGGFVIPAATGERQIVVNGMSPSSRGGQWSNSGMVVELRPEDVVREIGQMAVEDRERIDGSGALSMMCYQEYLEKLCWQQGNMKQTAPAQRMADFCRGKLSYDLPHSSYAPGLVSSPLHFWLPKGIASRLQDGFSYFGKQRRGFLTNEACLIAAETRTSSPVRITRDSEKLSHIRLKGLYPCGEGAGYAGGIVSAAVDGERCADMICAAYQTV